MHFICSSLIISYVSPLFMLLTVIMKNNYLILSFCPFIIESFIFSDIDSARCMVCKCFLQFYGLLLVFLVVSLMIKNFNHVSFICLFFFCCLIFLYYTCDFFLTKSKIMKIEPHLFFQGFKLLAPTFRALIQCE